MLNFCAACTAQGVLVTPHKLYILKPGDPELSNRRRLDSRWWCFGAILVLCKYIGFGPIFIKNKHFVHQNTSFRTYSLSMHRIYHNNVENFKNNLKKSRKEKLVQNFQAP